MPDLVGVRALSGALGDCAIGLLRDPALGSAGSRLSAYERLCLPFLVLKVMLCIIDIG